MVENEAVAALQLTGDEAADDLLSTDPLALLVGMLLDQQFPMERAFAAPKELARRLGTARLDAAALAGADPEALAATFAARPALHRYPAVMARRTQALATVVAEDCAGDAAALWRGATSGPELVARLEALPGFGARKARIFAALLGKQLGVRPPRWRQACHPFGEEGTRLSIADVVDGDTLAEVRAEKRRHRAPGGLRRSR